MSPRGRTRRTHPALLLLAILTVLATAPARANQAGNRITSAPGIQQTTRQIMSSSVVIDPRVTSARIGWEIQQPDRSGLPERVDSPDVSAWPQLGESNVHPITPFSPQVPNLGFTGATLTDTGSFPPDDMGSVGPSQFIVFVNGRLRSFNKVTGAADGVLDANPDVFFASVMTPVVSPVVINFTSDPQIRYDRLSGRWFLTIIDVPCTNATCSTLGANRLLLAVSDGPVITGSTVWTLYWFQGDATNFLDYPSLGVDAKALYIGGDMFAPAGSFVGTNGYVVRKSSALSGGPLVVTAFPNLALGAADGPFAPRGVDNFDPLANEGYFLGVSNSVFGELVLRRVSDPGGSPTISGNILIPVSTTSTPIPVQHLGNTGGNSGRLDALDDRVFAAHIRNGRLWTAQNIAVTSAGVASSSNAARRDGMRWYELYGIRSTDNGGTPVVVQSGTLFDNASTLATSRQYFIPTVMVSGQGHAAFGYSTAGTPNRADAGTVGRLAGDVLGTLGAPLLLTGSGSAYNPPADPGPPRRWGDYSFVSLDPIDDMTMWMIEQFCDATNSYGCRVARLKAPLPATPSSATDVPTGLASVGTTVTGTVVSGSGFFDPGADLPGVPAFNHLTAVVTATGVTGTPPTVNGVTYVNPTTILLDLNTTGATANLPGEKYAVKVTNPDGQVIEGTLVLRVFDGATATLLSSFVANPVADGIELRWSFGSTVLASDVRVQRAPLTTEEWTNLAGAPQIVSGASVLVDTDVEAGQTYRYRLVVGGASATVFGPVTGTAGALQNRFTLDSVRPNPTSGAVQIGFTVAKTGPVRLSVMDVQGREVAVLAAGDRAPGRYVETWEIGGRTSPGVYFVRYRAGGAEQSRRLTIAR